MASAAAPASSATSGKKRKRAEAPVSHSLAGTRHFSAKLVGDGSFVDVFVKEVDSGDARGVLAYSQGRELAAEEWVAVFRPSGRCAVAELGDVAETCKLYYALLRFADAAGAAAALTQSSSWPATDGEGHALGMRGWLNALSTHKVDSRVLQSAVDEYVAAFDEAEATADAAKAELARRMDADGFTVVKRARREDDEGVPMPAAGTSATAAAFGAAAAAAAGGAGAASAGYSVASLPGARGGSSTGAPLESDNAKRKKKRGSLMKNDFYAFQKQDAKLGKLAELRARFEEDRQRILKLKETRAFRPY